MTTTTTLTTETADIRPTATMKAIQFHGKEDIRCNEIATPEPGPGQVRIRPAFVGICGTDVHEYARGATMIPTESHPLTGQSAPITLGHEISGVVESMGEAVNWVNVGDRVAVQPIIPDGECYACQLNRPNCCTKQGFYGLSSDGGLAEHIVVDAENARRLPSNVSLELAALVEPLSVGWHAVTRGITEHTTSALVMGAGPIGLCAVQALRARKIPKIIIADVNVNRQAAAQQAGAHHFLNPATEDVAAACARLCKDSGGVHVAFDTAGKQVTLDTCLSAVSVGGTVVNIAIWGGEASISPNLLTLGEKRYMGSPVYTREDFDEVIQAIASGLVDPAFMVTSKIALSQVVSHGILKLLHDPGAEVKILIDMSKS